MKLSFVVPFLVITIILAGGIVWTTKNTSNEQPVNTASQVNNSQTHDIAENNPVKINLLLKPEVTSTSIGEEFLYLVIADLGMYGTSIANVELQYDPKILSIISMDEGSFMKGASVLNKTIDSQSGTISFILGSQEFTQGKGTLFTIRAKALGTNSITSPLSFNQEKVKLGLEDKALDIRYPPEQVTIVFEEQPSTIKQ